MLVAALLVGCLPCLFNGMNLPSHCSATNAVDSGQMKLSRIAIGFYGMSRNLPLVLPSIERNVFETLREADILFDVYSSTLSAQSLKNKRSNEHGQLSMFDIGLLRPCYFTVASQESIREDQFEIFMKHRNLSKSDVAPVKRQATVWENPVEATMDFVTGSKPRQHHHPFDAWSDDFASVKNLLCAFHSLKALHILIDRVSTNHGIAYDAVMVLRIDTAQIVRTDISTVLSHVLVPGKPVVSSEKVIALPDFQHWGGYNDRLAFGTPLAMTAYLTRGDWYLNSSYPVTGGEEFLRLFLTREQIKVVYTNMRCLRVRVDGRIAEEDYQREQMNLPEDAAANFHHCIGKDHKIRSYSC